MTSIKYTYKDTNNEYEIRQVKNTSLIEIYKNGEFVTVTSISLIADKFNNEDD